MLEKLKEIIADQLNVDAAGLLLNQDSRRTLRQIL